MYNLGRRLESLEKSVHATLVDLVEIATHSGVPDKIEGPSPRRGKDEGYDVLQSSAARRVAAHVHADVVLRSQAQLKEKRAEVDTWARANRTGTYLQRNVANLRVTYAGEDPYQH